MQTIPVETKSLLNRDCVATILHKGDTKARIRGYIEQNNGVYSLRPAPMDGSLDTVIWLGEMINVDFNTYVIPQIVILY
jgi:hypothetical protein